MKHLIPNLLAVGGCLAFGLVRAAAQTPGAVDQVDSVQQQRALQSSTQLRYDQGTNAPELYPGESDDVGPQSVLTIKPRMHWVEGTIDSQYLRTDNMFLARHDGQRTGVMISTAQIALAPTPYPLWSGIFSPRIGFRQQWFDFFEYHAHSPSLSTFDFNVQTIFADEQWTYGNWILGGGIDYNRLMTTASYYQFYSEFVPRWEATRLVPLCENCILSLSYQGYYHIADAPQFQQPQDDLFSRLDEAALVALSYQACSHVIVQPYYRFKYTHFTSTVDRNDYLSNAGVGVYYFFNRQCSLRAFANYEMRRSDMTVANYDKLDAGAGVNFDFKF